MKPEAKIPEQKPNEAPKPVPKKKKTEKKGYSVTLIRVILTNLVNIVLVILVFVFLSKLPEMAKEIQKAKNTNTIAESTSVIAAISAELTQETSKIDQVKSFVTDEKKLLSFIRDIDTLKNEGVITDFSFLSNAPVVDKTKNPGLIISIEFKGSRDQVNSALGKILTGGYFIRAVDFDLKVAEDNSVSVKYGGVLYVSEDIH